LDREFPSRRPPRRTARLEANEVLGKIVLRVA
jgi:hypothetical protein